MKPSPQIVISASRRTDIPAFYMPWFMACIEKGYFETVNPYNRRVTTVPATPEQVHTIAFWSKNYGPFLDHAYGRALQERGFHLFFNFTLNSASKRLEPCLPPLAERLNQMDQLCRYFGPEAVNWRFDPICFYRAPNTGEPYDSGDGVANNLFDFDTIAARAARAKIRRCITSFVDLYPKVKKRAAFISGISFVDPPIDQKVRVLLQLERKLIPLQIQLRTCCEKPVLEALPAHSTIRPSACIPNHTIMRLYGGQISLKKDAGQRASAGCECRKSTDVGIYHEPPCHHRCLFCYANPAPPPDADIPPERLHSSAYPAQDSPSGGAH